MLAPWKKSYDQPRQFIKKQRHYFASKGLSSQSYVFSNSHVGMWQLIHKEGWALKNWCFGTVVLEKTLESSVDCKEIKLGNPKGNTPWLFIGRTDAEDEPPIFWSPDVKGWLTGKDLWCLERLKAAGEGNNRGWDGGITDSIDMNLSKLWGTWHAAVHRVTKSQTWLSDQTANITETWIICSIASKFNIPLKALEIRTNIMV